MCEAVLYFILEVVSFSSERPGRPVVACLSMVSRSCELCNGMKRLRVQVIQVQTTSEGAIGWVAIDEAASAPSL